MVPGEDAVACDHVVDADGIESRARRERGQALSEQRLGVYSVQGAVRAALTARRTDGIQNPCVDDELPSLRAPRLWVGRWSVPPPAMRSVFSLSAYGNTVWRERVLTRLCRGYRAGGRPLMSSDPLALLTNVAHSPPETAPRRHATCRLPASQLACWIVL